MCTEFAALSYGQKGDPYLVGQQTMKLHEEANKPKESF